MVESVLIFIQSNPPEPSNIPTSRNTTTSGMRSSLANTPEKVPAARMGPNTNSACLANTSEVEDSMACLVLYLVDATFRALD
jgi:hypothetical protein